MPQMMPLEWTTLYAVFLMTFLMFNITNYFTQTPSKVWTTAKINVNKMSWKW
uniref:ATP synthase F0 subunit 8 n=1 Tax=Prorhinotermes canalifrons TaxID=488276 RepID=A0A0A7E7N3_9NEOP|nr:ATP synthase F0 subunit 8 [Prorhinotermes canalifrons]